MFAESLTKALSLYIHVPWCQRKCPYCDFNSHALKAALPEGEYVKALLLDLDRDRQHLQGRTLTSIFIGGGTPSLMSGSAIDELLQGVRRRIQWASDIEITLEANPGSVDSSHFYDYQKAGVNRLSIGAQSFRDQSLTRIGRIHDRQQALDAIRAAHQTGFTNLNIDLMFGLPGQTPEQAMDDLQSAIDQAPNHISWYQLTIEPNTWFHHHPPETVHEDLLASIQDSGIERLSENGYHRYEVSAFSKPAKRCRHNLNYWKFGDYIGIGAGAHGKITDPTSGIVIRTSKPRNPGDYIAWAGSGAATMTQRQLDQADLILEFMMNACRLSDGFPTPLFEHQTGIGLEDIIPTLNLAAQRGLLRWNEKDVRPTQTGQRFLNELLTLFVPQGQ